MTRGVHEKLLRPALALCGILCFVSLPGVASAAPFGAGTFGNNTPFGSTTSLGIALSGDVNLGLALNGGTLAGTGSTTLTVTSTAAEGYGLYMYADGSSDMVNGGSAIPASANGTASPLASNTLGYNTSGSSTNFLGLTTLPTLIRQGSGPFTSGDSTTVTFGVDADTTKEAGNYSVSIIYTAVTLN